MFPEPCNVTFKFPVTSPNILKICWVSSLSLSHYVYRLKNAIHLTCVTTCTRVKCFFTRTQCQQGEAESFISQAAVVCVLPLAVSSDVRNSRLAFGWHVGTFWEHLWGQMADAQRTVKYVCKGKLKLRCKSWRKVNWISQNGIVFKSIQCVWTPKLLIVLIFCPTDECSWSWHALIGKKPQSRTRHYLKL